MHYFPFELICTFSMLFCNLIHHILFNKAQALIYFLTLKEFQKGLTTAKILPIAILPTTGPTPTNPLPSFGL